MEELRLPQLNGTPEEQLEQLKRYHIYLIRELNNNLRELDNRIKEDSNGQEEV